MKKIGRSNSESVRLRYGYEQASFGGQARRVAVYPPKERRRGAGSNNDSHFQDLSIRTKINVIKNSTYSAYDSEDDILCEMKLKL